MYIYIYIYIYIYKQHGCTSKHVFCFRFLEQITVRDIRTKRIYQFVCNDWLTPDEGDDVVRYTLQPTGKLPYTYTLRVRSLQGLRDQHIWLSIFVCPRHSTFKRVQRLSCGLAFVTSAMLANIMFYDSRLSQVHEELIYDAIKLDLTQLIIGAQCCMLTLPLSMLNILIFRFISPLHTQLKVTDADDTSFDPINGSSATTTSSDDDNNSDNDSISSDDNDSNDFSDSDPSDSDRKRLERPAKTENKGTLVKLPWWFTYIGWALAIGTSVMSSYAVLMYGLTFGLNKSVAWLISFLASATHNIGIMQPLKVAIIVIIVTLLLRAPVQPIADLTPRINLGRSFVNISVLHSWISCSTFIILYKLLLLSVFAYKFAQPRMCVS